MAFSNDMILHFVKSSENFAHKLRRCSFLARLILLSSQCADELLESTVAVGHVRQGVLVGAALVAVWQVHAYQQGLYDAGYKMNLGVFEPIGGGAVEANIIQVRAIAATPSDFGKVLDDFYAGSVDMGGDHWLAAMSLVDEITSDYIQECAQIYTAEG